ncbi:uncharacterized protein TM35_000321510 [Trypanosoma theileri]|uniref:Uncharacterized protein n=1 Tax=Trypanosoma theileri TaxID=67003 RepID=A0A1X0NM95_9TRYP|nr:uncharacterized protein TM35_000321510 [Trypanosoma theileri]ORC85836.1 hypothetical protein TM35_000321510 [Trypanosoma theileri]
MYRYHRKPRSWGSPQAEVSTPTGMMPLASTVVPTAISTASPVTRETSASAVGAPTATTSSSLPPMMMPFTSDYVGTQMVTHPMSSSSPIAGGVTPNTPPNAIQTCFETFQRYMSAISVHAEEKASILSMIESLTHYAQERLRIKEKLDEGEACLQQFIQLRGNIDAALAGISSATPSCLTDSFASFSQPPSTIGSAFSTASIQRGRAKVDTDLAECRRLLQQLEMFARSFHDLQRRRIQACEILTGGIKEDENEQQHHQQLQLPPPQVRYPSLTTTQSMGEPVSRLHTTLDDCITQLQNHWDNVVTTAVTNLLQKLSAHSQDTIGDAPVGEQDDSFSSDRIFTALLQFSDETMGRVETMRTRITRLGSSRIEEAEALEKLLASMDNYDPTAEQRANRRKQIDAELEDLRSWLGQIAQIRQRVVDVTEKLQQQQQQQSMLLGKLESAASSRRPSPCPFSHNGIESAASSCRPSSVLPGSLEEWRQTLIPTETGTVRETTAGGSGQAQFSFFPQDSSPAFMLTTAVTGGAEPATASAADHNDNEDGAANRKAASISHVETRLIPLSSTTAADGTTEGNENDDKNGMYRDNVGVNPVSKGMEDDGAPRTFRTASGTNDHNNPAAGGQIPTKRPRSTTPIDNNNNNNTKDNLVCDGGDDDDDDDSTSCYHASAFDAGYRRRRPQRKRGGYFGSLLSFARAVVDRATRFSDSEDDYDYYDNDSDSDDDEMSGNKRRRQRLE